MSYLLSQEDIGWIAGFLEGEGSFGFIGNPSTPKIGATQKDIEPLLKLQGLVGGRVFRDKHGKWKGQPVIIHRWYLLASKARSLLAIIFPLMSARRQAQIQNALLKRPSPQTREFREKKRAYNKGYYLRHRERILADKQKRHSLPNQGLGLG